MVKLSIQDSEGRTTVVPLTDGELTIGRDPDNAICLTDRNVSRHHARLDTQGKQVFVENTGASWGTRLNKLLLRERAELQEGDILQVGDYLLEIASDDPRKRDTALVDDSPTRSAGKGADGGTAMINMADIQSQLPPAAPSTPIPEQAQPRLVVESDNLRGLELRVTKTPIVVGRVRENADLVVDHRSISKEHARLTRLPSGTWQILDLGSANGMKVNGEPYSKSDVTTGDRIELGHVTLRFLAAGAPAPAIEDVGGPRRSRFPVVLGIAVVAAIVAGVAVVALSGGTDKSEKPAGSEEKLPTNPAADPAAAPGSGAAGTGATGGAEPGAGATAEAEEARTAASAALAKAEDLRKSALFAEALQVLKGVESGQAGNAQLTIKIKQLEADVAAKTKLDTAQSKLDTEPAEALELATELRGQLASDHPLREDVEKVAAAAKSGLSDKTAPNDRALGGDRHKAAKVRGPEEPKPEKPEPKAAAKPEPEPEPKPVAKPETAAPAAKSGADLYKDARDAQLNGKVDDAVALYNQAIRAGYGKAHKPLAMIARDRQDKVGCVKHAKAYIEKNPSAGDAEAMQQMLEKCSN